MSNQDKKALPGDLVRRIGMLRKQCGIVDDDYYTLLSGYGVESCKDLSIVDARNVVCFLEGLPGCAVARRRPGLKYEMMGFREGFATPRQLRMLEALWKDVSVVVDDAAGRHAAFQQFLWNRFNIVSVENIQQCDVGRIKKTLESMLYAKNSKRKEG